jgi:hypothetical protein
MKGLQREFDRTQNIITKRITVTFLGLATFLIFLGGNDEFVYSQVGEQLGAIPENNETSANSSNSSASPVGFVSKGTINTLITVPNGKWLAAGNWSLTVDNGNVTSFDTKMTWYNSSGTNAHTHELTNFRNVPSDTQTSPVSSSAKQIVIKGVSDVGANGKVSWTEIPTTISINDRKIISIAVDDTKTNRHFGGQPLLGIVDSFTPCSNLPGPNMELLPSCAVTTDGEIFGQSNESLGLSSENFSSYQGVPLGGDLPQQGFPEQGFPGGDFPSEDSQSGSGFPQQGFPEGDFPSDDSQSGSGFPQQGFPEGDIPSEDDQSQAGESASEDDNQTGKDMNPECTNLKIRNVTASGFESDPSDYHPPSDAIDGDSSTWWSNNGKDPWLQIDLDEAQSICGISVEWNKGDSRDYAFEIGISQDGNDYKKIFEGNNNKGSSEPEIYAFDQETNGKYLRVKVTSTSSNDGWVSIKDVNVLGLPDR